MRKSLSRYIPRIRHSHWEEPGLNKLTQRGATLIEFLASMSIAALIAGGAGVTLFQILDTSNRNDDRFTALHEVENAHYWVGKDARAAQTTDLADGGPAVDNMTLSWVDGSGTPHSSAYALFGSELRRNYDGGVLSIARNLSSIQFSRSSQLITVSLTSSPGNPEYDEARNFYIHLRPGS